MREKVKVILVAGLIVAGICGCNYFEHNYTRDNCEVIEETNEGFVVVDRCDETWFFEKDETIEGLQVGDTVDLKMNDNCTASYIDDDIIKKVIKR